MSAHTPEATGSTVVTAIRAGAASALPAGTDHRVRLVAAMGELIAERGYAAVTVTDVVSRARVSKRTFYQHFSDREDCLLATYRVVAQSPLHRIAEAAAATLGQDLGLRREIEAVTGAYLEAMAEHPLLTRAMLVEPGSTGAAGRAARREVMGGFADGLVALTAVVDGGAPHRPLTVALAQALVGGINELVLEAVETADHADVDPDEIAQRIRALGDTVTELALAVLDRPA